MTRIRIIIAVGLLLAIVAGVALIRHNGETAGAAKVTAKTERAHSAGVAEARTDERSASDTTAAIARSVSRSDDLADALVKTTIKDLRDALDAVPAAAPSVPLPAAPVDRLRDSINAGIDRANRAAEVADAAP
ncbi:hypothetical protein NHF48_007290 [Sphingomonas sp. H160509]|uniref:hypothetical protein n=1 Tax=Sphingomonas sp. H160509 TaxID=2955313 RepID=UPI002097A575|nr:hypothetical protein [Sphingomonas sp. H160509]MDD1450805.1 hypothetical protein [Sphingomonas sp. H160509]